MQKLKSLDKLLAVAEQWAGKPGLKMTFTAQCTKASTWETEQRNMGIQSFLKAKEISLWALIDLENHAYLMF